MQPSMFPFPEDKSIIKISSVAYLKDSGQRLRVIVNHHDLFDYDKADKASEVAAIVTLFRSGAAKKTELSGAFNLSRHTVSRYVDNVKEYGLSGLWMTKCGPQAAHKIVPKVSRFIVDLLREGKGIAEILRAVETKWDLKLSRTSIERIRGGLPKEETKKVAVSTFIQGEIEFVEEEEEKGEGISAKECIDDVGIKSLVSKKAISSDEGLDLVVEKEASAGVFLVWPFLELLRFKDMVKDIFEPIKGRFFFVLESLLTILQAVILRCASIEDYKVLENRLLGRFWEGGRGMDLRTLRRKLSELSLQKKGLSLLEGLAKGYQEIGHIQLGVLYFDGHFIPYYGESNLAKGFFSLRRLVMPGQEQFFLNDIKGRPVFFWLKSGNKSLLEMLPEVIKEIKQLTKQESFTIIFDRGGFYSKLFAEIDKGGIKFITYLRGSGGDVHDGAFKEYILQYRHREEGAELAELGYIGMHPKHYRAVVRKKGKKQTFILTNDWDSNIDRIATLIFNRWGQENFFKYMIREYNMDSVLSYLTEESSEATLVNNPARKKNRGMKKEMMLELQRLEHFLADKLGKISRSKKMIEKIKQAQERVSEIKKAIKELNLKHKEMPKKIPASQLGDNRCREIILQEKKILIDSLKLLAYNAEEWLLDIMAKKYKDYRDFRRILVMILKQSGSIQRIDDNLVIRLNSFHRPKYQHAAVYLCEEINRMKIPAPSGKGSLYFEVKK